MRRRAKSTVATGLSASGGRRRWGWTLLVIGLTLTAFWPSIHNQFVNWDDDQNLLENTFFRGFTASNLRWMFTSFHLNHYHPLTWLSLALDYTLWGLDPQGYHFTNVLLHTVNALLVYRLALLVTGNKAGAAAWGALLFAIHPLRVESVAWVTERRDVLCGMFYLLSALAYLRAHRQGPRGRWLAGSVALFAAALLSKVIAVSLPVALLALDVYPLKRLGAGGRWLERQVWLEKIPYGLLAAAAAWVAVGRHHGGVSGFAEHLWMPTLGWRVGAALYGLTFYLRQTVFPFEIYPQYPYPGFGSLSPQFVAGVAAPVLVTAAMVSLRRRFPAGMAVWACYVAGLAPVLGVRVDGRNYGVDHHTYLATLALALLAAAGLAALDPGLEGPLRSRMALAMAVVTVAGLYMLTQRQIPVWHDSLSLWSEALAGAPGSSLAHSKMGVALAASGRAKEALPHFQQVVAIEPGLAQAHNDVANCYVLLNRDQDAEPEYARALEIDPDMTEARFNLAHLLQRQGRLVAAIPHYERVLSIQPARLDARLNLGTALVGLGRLPEAMAHYRQALAVDSQNADVHNNLGVALEAGGRLDDAAAEYREAQRLNPSHPQAGPNLARVLNRQNR